VGGEVLGEGGQDARDEASLLDGQVASVGVGDDREPLPDPCKLGPTALPGGDPVKGLGDLSGAELARNALPAGLDIEEAGEHPRDLDHAGGVVVDDEAGSPEAGAGRLHVLVAEPGADLLPGQHRVGHSGQDGPDAASSQRPAAVVEHLAELSTELHLDDVGPSDISHDGAYDRARRLAGAHGAEPPGSLGENVRDVGQRLDVVDKGGIGVVGAEVALLGVVGLPAQLGDRSEEAVQVRRQPAGEGVVALDDLEQRLLLAEQVLLGPGDHPDEHLPE
jgi:hypothetical protein